MRNLSVNSASAEDRISSPDSPACEFKCEITNSMQLGRKAKSQILFHNWVKHRNYLTSLTAFSFKICRWSRWFFTFIRNTIYDTTMTGAFFKATLPYVMMSRSGGGVTIQMSPELQGWILLSFHSGQDS